MSSDCHLIIPDVLPNSPFSHSFLVKKKYPYIKVDTLVMINILNNRGQLSQQLHQYNINKWLTFFLNYLRTFRRT